MGGHGANDVGLVALGRHSGVGRPTVGFGGSGWGDVVLDEGVQAGGGEVVDAGESDTARPAASDFDGAGDEQLAVVAASVSASDGVVFRSMIDRGLIDFHQVGQGVALGIGHGAAELGGQQPGAFIGAEAELPPKLKCRDTVRVGGYQVGGPEPYGQRDLATVHDGSGPDRCLTTTMAAFVCPRLGLEAPGVVMVAGGTTEPVGPADCGEIGGTGVVVWETVLKGDQRARIIGHGKAPNDFCS